jgi:hypothetical protein
VQSGFTRVTHTTTFSYLRGYGWTSSLVGSMDRGAPDYLLRDFVFSAYAKTFVVDAPSGYYIVNSLHMDKVARHEFTIDNQYDLTLPAGTLRFYWNSHYFSNKVKITLSDGWGPDPNWIINGLIITSAPW